MTEKQKMGFVSVEIEHYLDLKRKEQECEELKEKLERQQDYTVSYKSYIYEKEKQIKQQLDQYKQALDEIEEIAKKTSGECFYDDIDDCENCDMNFGCSAFNIRLMKRIINKAKEQ